MVNRQVGERQQQQSSAGGGRAEAAPVAGVGGLVGGQHVHETPLPRVAEGAGRIGHVDVRVQGVRVKLRQHEPAPAPSPLPADPPCHQSRPPETGRAPQGALCPPGRVMPLTAEACRVAGCSLQCFRRHAEGFEQWWPADCGGAAGARAAARPAVCVEDVRSHLVEAGPDAVADGHVDQPQAGPCAPRPPTASVGRDPGMPPGVAGCAGVPQLQSRRHWAKPGRMLSKCPSPGPDSFLLCAGTAEPLPLPLPLPDQGRYRPGISHPCRPDEVCAATAPLRAAAPGPCCAASGA